MGMLKFNIILLFFIHQVSTQCSYPFSTGDDINFCYYYTESFLSWSDAYNQCLSKTIDGILMQITSVEQFNALKNANIDDKSSFWLGANNFATFSDSQWHWIDGTVVDNSVITWCPDSTYETAVGTQCAVYNTTSTCVTNYLCNTLLPAPCVAKTTLQSKSIILSPRASSTSNCPNSYSGPYANWWTYSLLLLNWFILFCFVLHLSNRFNLNKRTVIITIITVILSFMTILAFAILWGVQYQNIVLIPLLLVILGCIASVFFLLAILVLVSSHERVPKWIICMILTIITLIIECALMIGLILCIAYCSAYISLTGTSLDKDITAAILAAIITAISVTFYNGILCLIGDTTQDRINVLNPSHPNPSVPLATKQTFAPRRTDGVNPRAVTSKKHEQIERATSPVDERILNEFYADHPRDMHKYNLEGRQYVVYEGKTFNEVDPFRKDITQAMLLQEPQGLREAIARVKNSAHAPALAEEIRQAENLLNKLK